MSEKTILPTEETPSPPRPQERRAVVRYPCDNASIAGITLPRYERLGARVRDVSLAGIGLVTRQELKPDTQLAIAVKSKDRPLSFELRARVARAAELPDGTWAIGCEFCSRLTQQELRILLLDN